jgi:hypothetical protein
LSQYADDTSLILDGSPASLDAEISGIKINLEKTNVIWIGSIVIPFINLLFFTKMHKISAHSKKM